MKCVTASNLAVIDNSTTSANGRLICAAGTDRVDNFLVAGTAVPEPGTLVLLGAGGAGLTGWARRRPRRVRGRASICPAGSLATPVLAAIAVTLAVLFPAAPARADLLVPVNNSSDVIIASPYADDAVFGPFNMGINFPFFGSGNNTQANVSVNGNIQFGTWFSGIDFSFPYVRGKWLVPVPL